MTAEWKEFERLITRIEQAMAPSGGWRLTHLINVLTS